MHNVTLKIIIYIDNKIDLLWMVLDILFAQCKSSRL
jgi:cadmium resistance protein CadD (predicted permease)